MPLLFQYKIGMISTNPNNPIARPSTVPRCIRVAIVEDDMDFLNALAATIDAADDMVLAVTASTRKDGLLIFEREAVDVLVVDLGLPDGSGIDIIQSASQCWPDCAVMVSTNFGDESHVMRSIEAGAAGYLLKHAEPASLASEIRSIHEGGSPISPLIARQMLMRFRHAKPAPVVSVSHSAINSATNSVASGLPSPSRNAQGDGAQGSVAAPISLSQREQEVLELITKGFTADEIARLMQVSHHTVLTFIRRIYRKLNVKSKAEAIYEARAQGLLL